MKDKKEISIEEFVLNYFGFSKNRITFDNEMVREIKIIKRVIPVVKGFLKEQHEKELEGYKKKVDKVTQIIWEYHTIHGSLSTDFVIKEVEKLKEVKSK